MGVDEFPATHRLVTLLNKPPVLTRAAILENTSIDGTATSCQEVIRFLGMAFWAEFFCAGRPVNPTICGNALRKHDVYSPTHAHGRSTAKKVEEYQGRNWPRGLLII